MKKKQLLNKEKLQFKRLKGRMIVVIERLNLKVEEI